MLQCYCICFDLVQIKSTTLTRVPEKSFGPLGLQNEMFDIHNSLSVSCPEFVGLFKLERGCSVPTTPWSTTKYSLSGHFFFFLWGCSGSIYLPPVLGVVYSGIESAHQFDPFAARNAAGDSWTQIRSGVREGGDEQFTHSIHQRWYLQFKKRNTNIFYNGKKPEI